MGKSDKESRKNAFGVVFSGGGLQGIAHVGAVKALHELELFPEYVSGTSSGAAMAALVAMGCDYNYMKSFAERYWESLADFRPIPIVAQLAALKFKKNTGKDGLKDGSVISNVIKKAMDENGVTGFDDLPINLSICTNDTYTTCNYNQFNFIDGGSKDNLPVKILRDMGVGKVLAISFDIMDYVPETGLEGMMKVVWRALDLYSIDKTRESMKMADYCVQIKNSKTAIFSMENFDLTIQEGYDCVMAHKDELLRIFKN